MHKKLLSSVAPILGLLLAFAACSSSSTKEEPQPNPETPEEIADNLPFARGADVSWVTEEEANGAKWYDSAGRETEIFSLLKNDCGVNAIRLRVWVDPADGWCGLEDMLVKARRAHDLGLMLMIDFHFSDSWADPGKQPIPAAWTGMNLADTKTALAAHVDKVLKALKAENITPEWVQVGNETTNGMLWPLGQADKNARNFTELVNAGYDAVKAVFPESIVIVHLDRGNVMSQYEYIFGILSTYGGKYDMIGMSLYPDADNWVTETTALLANINTCWNRWKRPVMICEVGMNWQKAGECRDMLAALINGCRNDTSGHGRGIFYWEPQSAPGYNGGYDKGAFTADGKATVALSAFKADAEAHPDK